jgi:hypothetical protein
MRYTDVIHHGTWVAYYKRDPFSIFNNFYLNTNYWMYWNFAGELMSTYANMNFNSQFKNRWRMNGNFTLIFKNTSVNLLRGGPSFDLPGGTEFNINVITDQSKKIFFVAGNYHGFGDLKSYVEHEYYAAIEARPTNAISVTFEPTYSLQNRLLQYVQATSLNGDPRYLFAELDQKTFLFTFRLNYMINPELSIEYYGQPFVSAGKYTNFKRITETKADEFADRYHVFTDAEIDYSGSTYLMDENTDGTVDYSVDNPDFNFRQFRSNFVVRWEYLPGSTLFLVWSQGRTSTASHGAFDYGEDMKDLFGTTPHNVFLVKFSYWFSL